MAHQAGSAADLERLMDRVHCTPLPCIFVLPQLAVGQALRQSGAIAALPNARVSTLRKYYFTALVYRTLCRLQ